MIMIENPTHRIIALFVNTIVRGVYRTGETLHLWHTEKCSLKDKHFNKILLIEEEPIGDVVMATAIFPALRKRNPKAYIAIMVGSWAKDVFLNNPYIDEIIVQNCPWAFSDLIIGRMGFVSHLKYLVCYPRFLKKLKVRDFDLAIDFRGDFRNILLYMVMPGIKYRLSFGRSGGEYFLTELAAYNPLEHEVDKNFTILRYLGIETQERNISIYGSQQDEEKINQLLEVEGKDDCFFCVIHPGARRHVKLWPLERYAQIANFINAKYKAKIILTGTVSESSLVTGIIKGISNKSSVCNLAGKLNIIELATLLKKVNLLICPDTSIMHLATAFSTPTIALFGPGDPRQVGPYQKNAYVVDKKFSCRPCLQKRCKLDKDGSSACMMAISVEDVLQGIEKLKEKSILKK